MSAFEKAGETFLSAPFAPATPSARTKKTETEWSRLETFFTSTKFTESQRPRRAAGFCYSVYAWRERQKSFARPFQRPTVTPLRLKNQEGLETLLRGFQMDDGGSMPPLSIRSMSGGFFISCRVLCVVGTAAGFRCCPPPVSRWDAVRR